MLDESRETPQRKLWDRFPYGKAPLAIFLVAAASTTFWFAIQRSKAPRPDLILVTFSTPHQLAYLKAVPEFERTHHVTIDVQLAHWGSLQTRLQNAMLADTDQPDLVELLEGSLGFFTRGPDQDIGLLDLTAHVNAERLKERLVASRFSLWSARGHVYGLPHDVHPIMLAYRRDIVESLGIDVAQLDTWERFAEVGRRITKDLDGDGVIDRYMIDLPLGGPQGVITLMLQRGGQLFDEQGNPAFANVLTAQVLKFYAEQTVGPRRIAYDCGWGQPFFKAMTDGLVLFYVTPDWRSYLYQTDTPRLAGKLALMPLPAWEKGGRRTSVWGGTGLVITKHSKHPDLAWELARHLYLNASDYGPRFTSTGIIPPLKQAWELPELNAPNPFFSNQPIGKLYAELAPETPPVFSSPVANVGRSALTQVLAWALDYYRTHGEVGFDAAVMLELQRAETEVRKMAERNHVLQQGQSR
jgi:arabinosaccharide transport system substrate-binding protein